MVSQGTKRQLRGWGLKRKMDKEEELGGEERCLGMQEFITEDCRCLRSMAII